MGHNGRGEVLTALTPEEKRERRRQQVNAANRARKRAVDILIAEHPEDWRRLYTAECRVEGVTPVFRLSGQEQVEKIKAEIARLQQRLQETKAGG